MKRTDVSRSLQSLLKTIQYASVATVCADGSPWCTPLYVQFDDDLNMYWASWTGSQHSMNIVHHPEIFVVIYDTRASEGEGEGLYMRMHASMLRSRHGVDKARQIYTANFGEAEDHDPFVGQCVRRLFQARPLRLWSNGNGRSNGQYIDVRYELPAL